MSESVLLTWSIGQSIDRLIASVGGQRGGLGAPRGARGAARRGERSRSQLLLKEAGTGTKLILGWLFKFGC